MHNLLFTHHDVRSELGMNPVPSAVLFDEEAEDRPLNWPDIILNPEPYEERTQNEDYRYFRLPVASLIDSNKQTTELLRTDPIIEPLLFPVLYPFGRGHWIRPAKENRIWGKDTLLQSVWQKLNNAISHFWEDHY